MIKVKEMKDDAIVNIPVSKGYYIMVKNLAFHLVNKLIKDNKSEDYISAIGTKDYAELDDDQRSVRTVTLLVAEIEAQTKIQNQFSENEVLEPGDEGYVAPTIEG
jgi:hypothetical protein